MINIENEWINYFEKKTCTINDYKCTQRLIFFTFSLISLFCRFDLPFNMVIHPFHQIFYLNKIKISLFKLTDTKGIPSPSFSLTPLYTESFCLLKIYNQWIQIFIRKNLHILENIFLKLGWGLGYKWLLKWRKL